MEKVCFVIPLSNPRLDIEWFGLSLIKGLSNETVDLTILVEGNLSCYNSLKLAVEAVDAKVINLESYSTITPTGSGLQSHFTVHYKVLTFLKENSFAEVIALDYRGLTYYAQLAKHQNLYFQNTSFTICAIKPSIAFTLDTHEQIESIATLGIAYLERRVCELAKPLISNDYLLEWMLKGGYRLERSEIKKFSQVFLEEDIGAACPPVENHEDSVTYLDFFLVSLPEHILNIYLKSLTQRDWAIDQVVEIRFFLYDFDDLKVASINRSLSGIPVKFRFISFHSLNKYAERSEGNSLAIFYQGIVVNSWMPAFFRSIGVSYIFASSSSHMHAPLNGEGCENQYYLYPDSLNARIDSFLVSSERKSPKPTDMRLRWQKNELPISSYPSSDVQDAPSPLVTVCVVHHERPKFLARALEGFKLQTYDNFELVVMDDGSRTNASVEGFQQLAKEYEQLGWRFISQDNKWLGAARNELAKHSNGEYLVFFDDDNIPLPEFLETYVNAICNSHVDALTCFQYSFVEDDYVSYKGLYPDARNIFTPIGGAAAIGLFDNFFGDASCIVKREVFFNLGGFWEHYGLPKEDHDFYCRLVSAGFSVDVVPEPLYFYRLSSGGMMGSNRANKAFDFSVNQIVKNHPSLVGGSISKVEYQALQMIALKFWSDRQVIFRLVPHRLRVLSAKAIAFIRKCARVKRSLSRKLKRVWGYVTGLDAER